MSDYTKISVLGKGTYGEVYKCVHNQTQAVIAMKTFIFEVRAESISLSYHVVMRKPVTGSMLLMIDSNQVLVW